MATVAGLLAKYRGWAADCEKLQAEYQAGIDRLEGNIKDGDALETNARPYIESYKSNVTWCCAQRGMAEQLMSDLKELSDRSNPTMSTQPEDGQNSAQQDSRQRITLHFRSEERKPYTYESVDNFSVELGWLAVVISDGKAVDYYRWDDIERIAVKPLEPND